MSIFDEQDDGQDRALRPRRLDEFVGQARIVDNLRVYIRAAISRGESLDHVLLAGPPGLGKTTLAHIIGRELKREVRITSGPVIDKPETWPDCSPTYRKATFFLSTRSTEYPKPWKNIFTRQWKIIASTL